MTSTIKTGLQFASTNICRQFLMRKGFWFILLQSSTLVLFSIRVALSLPTPGGPSSVVSPLRLWLVQNTNNENYFKLSSSFRFRIMRTSLHISPLYRCMLTLWYSDKVIFTCFDRTHLCTHIVFLAIWGIFSSCENITLYTNLDA